jgi:hypothetical protein
MTIAITMQREELALLRRPDEGAEMRLIAFKYAFADCDPQTRAGDLILEAGLYASRN